MSKKYAIITENLTKQFGKVLAVDKLNIKIPYGIVYGLLGPNGAGKTTTIRMLNAVMKPTSGSAKVAGYDILTEKTDVKMNCGLLPQTPGLYQKLTAMEFLRFIGVLYDLPKDVLLSRIDELLKIFELTPRRNDVLEGFSGGMQQKVSLSAALIHDPNIIFMDEPTANLDPASARIVKDMIFELVKKANKTIILSTHLLDIAEELCDQIGIINKGAIQVEGSQNEILDSTDTKNLEECYIKIIGKSHIEDYLSWRSYR